MKRTWRDAIAAVMMAVAIAIVAREVWPTMPALIAGFSIGGGWTAFVLFRQRPDRIEVLSALGASSMSVDEVRYWILVARSGGPDNVLGIKPGEWATEEALEDLRQKGLVARHESYFYVVEGGRGHGGPQRKYSLAQPPCTKEKIA